MGMVMAEKKLGRKAFLWRLNAEVMWKPSLLGGSSVARRKQRWLPAIGLRLRVLQTLMRENITSYPLWIFSRYLLCDY
jgi:hypothetical protein